MFLSNQRGAVGNEICNPSSCSDLLFVDKPMEICSHVWSTGELGSFIREQSLIIETSKGLIVMTGCAHPGIVEIVEAAKQLLDRDIHLVLGGFHLHGASMGLAIEKSGR